MKEDRTQWPLLPSCRESNTRSPRGSERTRVCAWRKVITMRANNRFPFLKQVRKATVPPRVERLHRPTLVGDNATAMAEPCRKTAVMVTGLQFHSRH